MKSHEESLTKKEKSTEDKAKETGKITHSECIFPAGTKIHVFIDGSLAKWEQSFKLLKCS